MTSPAMTPVCGSTWTHLALACGHSLLCVPGTFAPVAHSCLCEMSLPDEEDCHAGAIEEATDGRGRGARCQARRTLEREPQGRLAAHGGEHERAAIARV